MDSQVNSRDMKHKDLLVYTRQADINWTKINP